MRPSSPAEPHPLTSQVGPTPREVQDVIRTAFPGGEVLVTDLTGTSDRLGHPFEVINIFDDQDIRPALVAYSKWPTTPQIFLNGELLVAGDILLELHEKGELQTMVDAAHAS